MNENRHVIEILRVKEEGGIEKQMHAEYGGTVLEPQQVGGRSRVAHDVYLDYIGKLVSQPLLHRETLLLMIGIGYPQVLGLLSK